MPGWGPLAQTDVPGECTSVRMLCWQKQPHADCQGAARHAAAMKTKQRAHA